MKKYFLLFIAALVLWGCSKSDTTTNTPLLSGTWREQVMYNTYYNASNVVLLADTMPVIASKATYYTAFKDNGQFESYSLNGSAKVTPITGTYVYNEAAKTFTQNWPLSLGTVMPNTNIGRSRASTGQNSNSYTYNILSFDGRTITISTKIPDNVYGAYDGGQPVSPGYTIQIRRLTKN